jgi:hypothetical protein
MSKKKKQTPHKSKVIRKSNTQTPKWISVLNFITALINLASSIIKLLTVLMWIWQNQKSQKKQSKGKSGLQGGQGRALRVLQYYF